jgi:hypothetical protein
MSCMAPEQQEVVHLLVTVHSCCDAAQRKHGCLVQPAMRSSVAPQARAPILLHAKAPSLATKVPCQLHLTMSG